MRNTKLIILIICAFLIAILFASCVEKLPELGSTEGLEVRETLFPIAEKETSAPESMPENETTNDETTESQTEPPETLPPPVTTAPVYNESTESPDETTASPVYGDGFSGLY